MSRPKPKFRIGQYARIVGCVSNPEANGQVVMLVDGPEWFEGETVERPNGLRQEIPPGWVYRTDIGTKPDWAHESRLQPNGEPARRATRDSDAFSPRPRPRRIATST
jgi:hypothetical protein